MDLANPKTNMKTAGYTQEERENFSTILADGYLDACKFFITEAKCIDRLSKQ
jgi:exodeoxyribonuclease III